MPNPSAPAATRDTTPRVPGPSGALAYYIEALGLLDGLAAACSGGVASCPVCKGPPGGICPDPCPVSRATAFLADEDAYRGHTPPEICPGYVATVEVPDSGYPPLALISRRYLSAARLNLLRTTLAEAMSTRRPFVVEAHDLDVFQLVDGRWTPVVARPRPDAAA